MRLAMLGLVAVTATICTGCTPAVGSPEWCKQMEANPPKDLASITPEMMQGAQKCAMDAINNMKVPGQ